MRWAGLCCLGFVIGCTGPQGANGASGDPGSKGDPGQAAVGSGSIHGVVKDSNGSAVVGAAIATNPTSASATTDSAGAFALDGIAIGSYGVLATKAGYSPFTLTNVGVAAGGTTSVSLVLTLDPGAPGAISGIVTDSQRSPNGLAGVVVSVQGQNLQTTTAADGSFSLPGVPPGPVFLYAKAPSTSYLDTETRSALLVQANATLNGVKLILSGRPSDTAEYVGVDDGNYGCHNCHATQTAALKASAHYRSLTRIQRDANGHAVTGGFARMLNATLKAPRTVMVPLGGTISTAIGGQTVTGAGSTFTTDVQPGDELGYTPVGLSWTKIGVVQAVASDTQLTLAANATLAPTVTTLAGASYGVKRTSRSYTLMLPQDSKDIVAPAWPGVKATNPNYDANDPCIYGNAPSGTTCAGGGTTKYADGQVNVYICNLKDGVTVLNDEYVQKFGGTPYSCSDGAFWDGVTTPAVPMVHIDVIYGGQGDKDGSGAPHPNMGVFKQRFQGRLTDVKAAAGWTYTTGKSLDTLTLPIQVLESGDKVNGGYKMNGYHPTEQKFPGESWTQRTRTFSHACAGCHATGLAIDWDMVTVTLPFGRDGAPNNSPMTFAAIKSYSYKDENLTCEHCHGPGKEHARVGAPISGIINPKYLTAESERQLCGKCHGYDDATNAKPAQDYGFEFAWNSDFTGKVGGGNYVPGVYDVSTFFDNWGERSDDGEAFWDPGATGGMLFGQAHRQQYTMLAQSAHANNAYQKTTCTDCHDPHSQYLGTTRAKSASGDAYVYTDAGYRDNVQCLSCHASGGPLAFMPATGPYATITKDDVANLLVGDGGSVTRNGVALAPSANEISASRIAIGDAVGQHMLDKANMIATYDPLNDAKPVGRCTSCHMPKLAKSGGYVTDVDANGNKALVEGDQASHVFGVVWPWQSNALSSGGPTYQSGWYGQMVSASNVKYDLFGYMPNSCSSCHTSARKASLVCPDTSTVWPAYWPFAENRTDPFWSSCWNSATAP